MKPIRWLKALGGVLLAVALVLLGKRVADLIKGEVGTVEGEGDTFVPVPGAPGLLDVWTSIEEPSSARRVVLPEGMTSDQVKAVRVIPGGRAVVEVLP